VNRPGGLGVWLSTDGLTTAETVDLVMEVEELGYTAWWLPETTGRDPFAHLALFAGVTRSLVLATGVANIHLRHPGAMKQAAMTLAEASDGRFLLGLGVSHARTVESLRGLDYSRPLSKMRGYLEEIDAAPYDGPAPPGPVPRVLAALGPKMLGLAGQAADGALPYSTTAEHTAAARQALGPVAMLCVEQKVVLTTDPEAGRAAGRAALRGIRRLPNYVRCWTALGFRDEEIDDLLPRFVDALVAWGDEEALRSRIEAHRQAGATHVCIQPLLPAGPGSSVLPVLRALAPRGSS